MYIHSVFFVHSPPVFYILPHHVFRFDSLHTMLYANCVFKYSLLNVVQWCIWFFCFVSILLFIVIVVLFFSYPLSWNKKSVVHSYTSHWDNHMCVWMCYVYVWIAEGNWTRINNNKIKQQHRTIIVEMQVAALRKYTIANLNLKHVYVWEIGCNVLWTSKKKSFSNNKSEYVTNICRFH